MDIETDYMISTPGIIRLALILTELGSWIPVAALFNIDTGNLSRIELYDLRTAFLVIFLLGFTITLVTYALGVFDYLGPTIWIIIVDIIFAIGFLILSAYAAYAESKYGALRGINRGAYGSAAAFGFLSALLLLFDAIWYIFLDDDGYYY